MADTKTCKESWVVKTAHVFPSDTNNHDTLFGGKLMSFIDDVASLSAIRHARMPVVTASTDSVDFLTPIVPSDSVCLESFVTWTGKSSMEVFVKVVAENLLNGDRRIAATAFLSFVALNEDKQPVPVPKIVPETDEEKKLYETAPVRLEARKKRRQESKELAAHLTTKRLWEQG
ncbi:acyl-CoA thioesterase [Alteribacter aurantiacus]|uniref:acyl-CoA thioesterase n=1 Tax=Alteribacter aurantiacus TaxID=254410 RepID=UPI000411423C|nr:acyl-CoA thioesterase [Alteribacter aurantiacus]